VHQQSGLQNPGQWAATNPQIAQMFTQPGLAIPGIGQAAYAPQYGQLSGTYSGPFGQPNIGAFGLFFNGIEVDCLESEIAFVGQAG
jgi:hypothetical protein